MTTDRIIKAVLLAAAMLAASWPSAEAQEQRIIADPPCKWRPNHPACVEQVESRPSRPSWTRTRASWSGVRPRYCYDRAGRHRVPNVSLWTAHPSLPCGTQLTVRRNGRRVTVTVQDHGPSKARQRTKRNGYGIGLDLSRAAFDQLGDPRDGIYHVYWRRT